MLNQAKHISQHKLCLYWTPWNQKKESIKLGEEKQLLIQEKLSTYFHKVETSRVIKKYLLLGHFKEMLQKLFIIIKDQCTWGIQVFNLEIKKLSNIHITKILPHFSFFMLGNQITVEVF